MFGIWETFNIFEAGPRDIVQLCESIEPVSGYRALL